jgi:hypothetical protein
MRKPITPTALADGARRPAGRPRRRTFVAPVVIEDARVLDAVGRDPFIDGPGRTPPPPDGARGADPGDRTR